MVLCFFFFFFSQSKSSSDGETSWSSGDIHQGCVKVHQGSFRRIQRVPVLVWWVLPLLLLISPRFQLDEQLAADPQPVDSQEWWWGAQMLHLLHWFSGEKAQDRGFDSMPCLMRWDDETPYLYFFKHGLEEEKCVCSVCGRGVCSVCGRGVCSVCGRGVCSVCVLFQWIDLQGFQAFLLFPLLFPTVWPESQWTISKLYSRLVLFN